jgi:lipid A 4'-phosphatase
MDDRLYDRLVLAFLLTVIGAQAAFAAFPGIDLAVSSVFAKGSTGFPWAEGAPAALNVFFRSAGELTVLLLALWCIWGGLSGVLHRIDLRAWGFALLTVVIANGAIVSSLLKAYVGRARPANITEFGGTAAFSPAWQVTDQCARNCSFSSGEVAMAASLAIAAVVLLWPHLPSARARNKALTVASAYVGIVALLRIGLGRHFLSDAVFSVLVSGAVALVLYRALRVGGARRAFDPRLPVLILTRRLREGRSFAQALLKRQT